MTGLYVYLDILIITSIYINFFLLKAAAKITHADLKSGKCVLGALAGSLFSLVILLPELSFFLLTLIRLLGAAATVYTAFCGKPLREICRNIWVFFFVSFLFAGVEYGLAMLLGGGASVWHNSVLYIDISLAVLTASTIISYAAISLFRRFLDSKNDFDGKYLITVYKGDEKAEFKAICDTCNNLTDSFSGKPVIVCGKESLKPIFNGGELEGILRFAANSDNALPSYTGWRLIPFNTVNSTGLLPSFLPSRVYIKNLNTRRVKYTAAYIGIVEKDMEYAVFNPKIL